jgi:DNA adenine methylase
MQAEVKKLPATPFLKWAGGKGQLLSQLDRFFPKPGSYKRYFEPFLGGGAVFFHLQPTRAILSDLNAELVNVYQVIRDNLPALLDSLRRHELQEKEDEDYYYWVRGLSLHRLNPVRQASRFIYLNKRCYNGLYRVNSKGEFNVPKGSYKTPPRIYDETNLKRVSELLRTADLRAASYDVVLAEAGAGDFVYLDPPYEPLSATANFTKYTKDSFDEADQARLAQTLHELDARGALFLLNNHKTENKMRMYNGFHIEVALAARMINSRADRRGGVEELIVTNYQPPAEV